MNRTSAASTINTSDAQINLWGCGRHYSGSSSIYQTIDILDQLFKLFLVVGADYKLSVMAVLSKD